MFTSTEKKIIAQCPLFAGLDDAFLQQVYASGKKMRFSKGEIMPCQQQVYVLLSGRVCIQRVHEDGHTVVLDYIGAKRAIGPAQIFIEESTLSQPYALSQVSGFMLRKECICVLLEQSIAFQRNYIQFLSNRVSFLTSKIAALTGPTVESRLLYYLHENADDTGVLTVQSITQLANLLHMGRASLYRAINTLVEDHVLLFDKHTFTLI